MLKKFLSSLLCVVFTIAVILPAGAAQTPQTSGSDNPYTDACEYIDSNYTYGGELGALYTPSSTTFRLWAPVAQSVKLNRFKTGSDSEPGAQNLGTTSMEKLMDGSKWTGVWTATVSGDIKNTYYTYSVTTGDVRGNDVKTYETQDVYSYATGVNGKRTMVVDLDSTDPEGWSNDRHVLQNNPTDSFVWEVHVKDFSYDKSSGVSDKNRGKYLAFTETGTTLNGVEGSTATCIDYLKKLGITTVQILPFFDYSGYSVDESGDDNQFNWGYDPVNYNVPEGSYSSNPYDGNVRIKECKQMIQALHNAGFSVVMDVVYNHTAGTDSCFGYTVPKYYYRMTADGYYSNGSGCGNETASERAMYRKFMRESLLYWANEYHIDGFRFDLMAIHDVETLNLIRNDLDGIDSRITLWGEGWTGGGTTMPAQTCTGAACQGAYLWDHYGLTDRVAFFNDGIRNSLKGDTGSIYAKGWLQGSTDEKVIQLLAEGMQAEKQYQINYPRQAVSYAACHDNATLWDQLCAAQGLSDYFYKRNEKIISQNKMAGAILNLSKGATFILAGEEMGRSKGGNHNSYNAPPDVNKIDWNLAEQNADLVSYYAGMREIRDHFSMLKDANSQAGFDFISTGGVMAAVLYNDTPGEWNKMLFIANSYDTPCPFQMPYGQDTSWVIIANDERAGVEKLATVNDGLINVAPNSIVVAVEAKTFSEIDIPDQYGSVHVNMKSKSTGSTIRSYTMTGKAGEKYSIYAPDNYGVDYVLESTSDSKSGTYTSEDKTIDANYLYIKPATISVNYYLKGTTTKIHASDVYEARVGDTVTLGDPPAFLGFKLDNSNLPDSTVKAVYGNVNVDYYYEKTTLQVQLHFKHSGSLTWAPVVWLWGTKDGEDTSNYCNNPTWPGDKIVDADGDGWYDKSFTPSISDDCYNLIVSSNLDYENGYQSCDYRNLVDSELWIVIDDGKQWNGADNLTMYTENPTTNPNAPTASHFGAIGYERTDTEHDLLNINKDSFITTTVSGYNADKTIEGAEVMVDINADSFPNDKYMEGYTVNNGEVTINMMTKTYGMFKMPSKDALIQANLKDKENYVADLSKAESVSVPAEVGDALRKQPAYSASNGDIDVNADGTADVNITSGNVVTKLAGADSLGDNNTLQLTGMGATDKYGSVTFNVAGALCTVTFAANGGSGEMSNATVTQGRPYTLPECGFTAPENKGFDCWTINGVKYAPGDSITVDGDITATATWASAVSLSFDANGGSGEMDDITAFTSSFILPECTFTAPDGYFFSEWEVLGVSYKAGDSVTADGDITAKAVWTKVNKIPAIPATCDKEGSIEYYIDDKGNLYADENGTPLPDKNGDGVIDGTDVAVPATGHTYGQPQWDWSDLKNVKATFTCTNDASHTTTVDAVVTGSELPNENVKLIRLTASVLFGGTYYSDSQIVNADDYDTDILTDTVLDSDSEETDTQSDTETDNTDTQSDTETETDNTDTETETETDNTDTQSDTGTETDNTDTQSDTETETDITDTETETENDNTDTQSDTETDDTDSQSDTETETDNSDTETDTEDTDTDSDTTPKGILGDVDHDNYVTSSDALSILRMSVGLDQVTSDIRPFADINGDHDVMSSDALDVLRYSVGLSADERIGKPIAA